MKRSLVVFVALGLLAGLVGCASGQTAESKSETTSGGAEREQREKDERFYNELCVEDLLRHLGIPIAVSDDIDLLIEFYAAGELSKQELLNGMNEVARDLITVQSYVLLEGSLFTEFCLFLQPTLETAREHLGTVGKGIQNIYRGVKYDDKEKIELGYLQWEALALYIAIVCNDLFEYFPSNWRNESIMLEYFC